MSAKKVLTWGLLIYVAATCVAMFVLRAGTGKAQVEEPAPPDTAVVVYYFYDSIRCQSCVSMESYTGQVVKGDFAKELKAGAVLWKPIDVEQVGNGHYLKDFGVLTKSVVVAEVKEGKPARFKNLARVWEFVKDEAAFKKYVKDEVAAYLGTRP